jgi:hypothetical protein
MVARRKRKDDDMQSRSSHAVIDAARRLTGRRAAPLVAAAGVLAAMTLVPRGASADDDVRFRPCSKRTLRGDYGFVISGTAPAGPNGETEQIVGTALKTYDGRGHFMQVDNVHGQVTGAALDRPGEGTYEVKADCTGTETFFVTGVPFPIVTSFVIVDGGAEIKSAVMSPPGSLITAIARKVR